MTSINKAGTIKHTNSKINKINNINIMGLTIKNLKPELIKHGSIQVSIPLKKGECHIPALHHMKLKIKDNTALSFVAEVERRAGALVIKRVDIAFSRSVYIKNPKGMQNNSSKFNIGDKLADVKLKHITLGADGKLIVDGRIKALKLFKAKLPKLDKVKLPDLEQNFFNFISGKNIRGHKNLSESIDIKETMARLSKIANKASYHIKLSDMSTGCSSLHGFVELGNNGSLLINLDKSKSRVKNFLGEYKLGLLAHVDEYKSNHVDIKLKPNISGRINNPYISSKESSAQISASKMNVKLKGSFDISLSDSHKKLSGDLKFSTTVYKPRYKEKDMALEVDGHVKSTLKAKELFYDSKKDKNPSLKGNAQFGFVPSKKFSELLRPVSYKYNVDISGDGMARIKPPKHGLTKLIKPVINLEGHKERVDNFNTKGMSFKIGSNNYFSHIENITGAKLRGASEVKILADGINSMPERIKIINQAKDYICFQTLVFKPDESGWQYAKALANAAKRGVKVYGIVDSLGNIENVEDIINKNPIYTYLCNSGVKLHTYNSFMEDALRVIFNLTNKNKGVFLVGDIGSIKSVEQMLYYLKQVIKTAQDQNSGLCTKDKKALQIAINKLLDGKDYVSSKLSINELDRALHGKKIILEKALPLLKRMGKASNRWHEKYLIVDGNKAIIGGMNIADEYLKGGQEKNIAIKDKSMPAWRDTDVLLKGDVVPEIYRAFRRNWLHVTHNRLPLDKKPKRWSKTNHDHKYAVSILQHRPVIDGDHHITNFLLYNLRTLKSGEKAWLQTAYFLPRGVLRALQKELIKAAHRGVDVRIVTNSKQSSDFVPLIEGALFDTRELVESGVKFYQRNDDRMVHAKVTVLGDQLTMIGSYNCDNRSAAHDSEDVCCIYDNSTNKEMEQILLDDMNNHSHEISKQEIYKSKIKNEIRSAGMLMLGELL